MLLNLHKKSWMEGLTLQDYSEHCKLNETIVKEMLELAKNYNKVHLLDLVPFKENKKERKNPASLKTWNCLKAMADWTLFLCAFIHNYS